MQHTNIHIRFCTCAPPSALALVVLSQRLAMLHVAFSNCYTTIVCVVVFRCFTKRAHGHTDIRAIVVVSAFVVVVSAIVVVTVAVCRFSTACALLPHRMRRVLRRVCTAVYCMFTSLIYQ